MKICLISNLYPPYERGGAEQVVKNTVEGLIDRGHEVVVITARPFRAGQIFNFQFSIFNQFPISNDQFPNPVIYRFFPFNLFFYGNDYKYPAVLRFFWHILDVFNLHSYFVIRRILKKERPDVVHTHNLKGLGYLIPAAIRSLGLCHVHTLHDVQLVEPSGIIIKGKEKSFRYRGWPVKIYAAVNLRLFGSPQVVISPSKFLLEFYEKKGFFPQSRKVVLPNPVIGIMNYELRIMNFDDGRPFRFLYLGQIEEHKGVLFLIEVFKKLISNIQYPISLHIVGAGSCLERAKNLAAGCPAIVFHGRLEREKLPDIFAATDLTIVPSLCYENSPTVIFESFSFGRPVLASSIEGVAELIRDGQNGLTFEAGNEADLLAKLKRCLENAEKIREMRPAALKSVEGLGLGQYLDKLLTRCYNMRLN